MFTSVLFFLMCCGAYVWDAWVICPLITSDIELRIDEWRLELRQKGDVRDSLIAEWGAQVHLLYCSAWAVGLGMMLGPHFPGYQSLFPLWAYSVPFAALLVAGVWHHVRLLWWISKNQARNVLVKDQNILGGVPVFRQTRVPFQALLDYLEGGQTLDDFLNDFPTVSREAAIAALEEAKALVVARLE